MDTKTESQPQHAVVCYGEVLWDVLPSKALPGGAPLNVSHHLKKLGTNPALITKVGIDEHGEKLINLISGQGISTEYFYVDNVHPTGLVNVDVSDEQEVTYDIVSPSAWDHIAWNEEFEGLMEHSSYFVFGSLSTRCKASRDTLYRLIGLAKTRVLDINLRAPHYNRPLVEHLLSNTDILKLNQTELELITGWFNPLTGVEERLKLVQNRFKLQTIIVTLGAEGAIVLHDGMIHRHPGFRVGVIDTIGSGDSFLAGYLHQLLNGAAVNVALDFASAMGAFTATQQGGCPEYSIQQVEALIDAQVQTKILSN